MAAVAKGHKGNVSRLLTKGADINAKLSDGKTALMIAAENGRHAVVKLLVGKGMWKGIDDQSDDGSTALTLAAAGTDDWRRYLGFIFVYFPLVQIVHLLSEALPSCDN